MSAEPRAEAMPDPTAAVEARWRGRLLDDCLTGFGEVTFTVTGQCMSPDLVEGDRVRLLGRAHREPRLGDVVLTRRADELRLHRLVWTPLFEGARAAWRTKADRARFLDPRLRRDEVLATVVGVEGRAYRRRPTLALRSLRQAVLHRARAAIRLAGAEP